MAFDPDTFLGSPVVSDERKQKKPFDPDEFLGTKKKFNPDEFLAKPAPSMRSAMEPEPVQQEPLEREQPWTPLPGDRKYDKRVRFGPGPTTEDVMGTPPGPVEVVPSTPAPPERKYDKMATMAPGIAAPPSLSSGMRPVEKPFTGIKTSVPPSENVLTPEKTAQISDEMTAQYIREAGLFGRVAAAYGETALPGLQVPRDEPKDWVEKAADFIGSGAAFLTPTPGAEIASIGSRIVQKTAPKLFKATAETVAGRIGQSVARGAAAGAGAGTTYGAAHAAFMEGTPKERLKAMENDIVGFTVFGALLAPVHEFMPDAFYKKYNLDHDQFKEQFPKIAWKVANGKASGPEIKLVQDVEANLRANKKPSEPFKAGEKSAEVSAQYTREWADAMPLVKSILGLKEGSAIRPEGPRMLGEVSGQIENTARPPTETQREPIVNDYLDRADKARQAGNEAEAVRNEQLADRVATTPDLPAEIEAIRVEEEQARTPSVVQPVDITQFFDKEWSKSIIDEINQSGRVPDRLTKPIPAPTVTEATPILSGQPAQQQPQVPALAAGTGITPTTAPVPGPGPTLQTGQPASPAVPAITPQVAQAPASPEQRPVSIGGQLPSEQVKIGQQQAQPPVVGVKTPEAVPASSGLQKKPTTAERLEQARTGQKGTVSVNEHGVLLNPEIIDIPIPKKIKASQNAVRITVAQAPDGKWRSGGTIGRGSGSMSGTSWAPMVDDEAYDSRAEAIEGTRNRFIQWAEREFPEVIPFLQEKQPSKPLTTAEVLQERRKKGAPNETSKEVQAPEVKGPADSTPFDSKAFEKARQDKIAKSKSEGNKHLDQIPFATETMRYLKVRDVISGSEGIVTAAASTGDINILWETGPYAGSEMREMPSDFNALAVIGKAEPADVIKKQVAAMADNDLAFTAAQGGANVAREAKAEQKRRTIAKSAVPAIGETGPSNVPTPPSKSQGGQGGAVVPPESATAAKLRGRSVVKNAKKTADHLRITFNGVQTIPGVPDELVFTDTAEGGTKSTFQLPATATRSDVGNALYAHRERFRNAPGSKSPTQALIERGRGKKAVDDHAKLVSELQKAGFAQEKIATLTEQMAGKDGVAIFNRKTGTVSFVPASGLMTAGRTADQTLSDLKSKRGDKFIIRNGETERAKEEAKYRDRVYAEGDWDSGNKSPMEKKVLEQGIKDGKLTKRQGRGAAFDEMSANGIPTIYEPASKAASPTPAPETAGEKGKAVEEYTADEFAALPENHPAVQEAAKYADSVAVGNNFSTERVNTSDGRRDIHRVYLRYKFNSDSSPIPLNVLKSHLTDEAPSFTAHDWFSREVYEREHPEETKKIREDVEKTSRKQEQPVETKTVEESAVSGTDFKAVSAFTKAAERGEKTAQEIKTAYRWMVENEKPIKAGILKAINENPKFKRKRSNTKEKIVEQTYTGQLERLVYSVGDGFSWSPFQETRQAAIERQVMAITDEQIQKTREERKARSEAENKALTNPETLSEFHTFVSHNGEDALSPDQRRRFDELRAESSMNQREEREIDRKATVGKVVGAATTPMQIVEKPHTKRGHNVFIVTMGDRVDGETFKELARKARALGGNWSRAWKPTDSPAGFVFNEKAKAEQFISLREGAVDKTAEVQAQKEDSKEASAERLIQLADRMEAKASESLNRDRQTNTARRARMAGHAEEEARRDVEMARTIRNIAEAVREGKAKFLRGIRTRTQVETLKSILNETREYSTEKYDGYGPSDPNKAKYPEFNVIREHVESAAKSASTSDPSRRQMKAYPRLAMRLRSLLMKQSGERVDVPEDLAFEIAEKIPSAAWVFQDIGTKITRLRAMNITNDAELRSALRELMDYQGEKPKEDKATKLRRDLVGSKIPGFFPTPPDLVQTMLDKADIQPGMSVLEPEAGDGQIADAVKQQHPDAPLAVIEYNQSLREILQASGHTLVGQDFLEHKGPMVDRIVMNPPFEDNQDIDHVRHAYDLLNPGGRLVAIMSEGAFFRAGKKEAEFRGWLDAVGGRSEKNPEASFTDKSMIRTTGTNTRTVVIDKPVDVSAEAKPVEPIRVATENPKTGKTVEATPDLVAMQRNINAAETMYARKYGRDSLEMLNESATDMKPDEWLEMLTAVLHTDPIGGHEITAPLTQDDADDIAKWFTEMLEERELDYSSRGDIVEATDRDPELVKKVILQWVEDSTPVQVSMLKDIGIDQKEPLGFYDSPLTTNAEVFRVMDSRVERVVYVETGKAQNGEEQAWLVEITESDFNKIKWVNKTTELIGKGQYDEAADSMTRTEEPQKRPVQVEAPVPETPVMEKIAGEPTLKDAKKAYEVTYAKQQELAQHARMTKDMAESYAKENDLLTTRNTHRGYGYGSTGKGEIKKSAPKAKVEQYQSLLKTFHKAEADFSNYLREYHEPAKKVMETAQLRSVAQNEKMPAVSRAAAILELEYKNPKRTAESEKPKEQSLWVEAVRVAKEMYPDATDEEAGLLAPMIQSYAGNAATLGEAIDIEKMKQDARIGETRLNLSFIRKGRATQALEAAGFVQHGLLGASELWYNASEDFQKATEEIQGAESPTAAQVDDFIASIPKAAKKAEAKIKADQEAQAKAEAEDKAAKEKFAKEAVALSDKSRKFTLAWDPPFKGATHPVELLKKAVGKKSVLPILYKVHVQGGVGMATDLETFEQVPVDLPDGVYVIVNGDTLIADQGAEGLEEFPPVPTLENPSTVKISDARWFTSAVKAAGEITKETSRFLTSFVWVSKRNNETLQITATDGSKELVSFTHPADLSGVPDGWHIGLSEQAVKMIVADPHAESLTLEFTDTHARIQNGNSTITEKLVEKDTNLGNLMEVAEKSVKEFPDSEVADVPFNTRVTVSKWEPKGVSGRPMNSEKVVAAGIPGRTTLPVLSTVNVEKGVARSTDLVVEVEVEAKVSGHEDGLYTVKKGKWSKSDIAPDEFPPAMKEGKETASVTLRAKQSQAFKENLLHVLPGRSTDESRYILNGVLLKLEGNELLVAATDGRRLHVGKIESEGFGKDFEATIPVKTAELMLKSNGEGPIKISIQEVSVEQRGDDNKLRKIKVPQLVYDDGNATIRSKLIEGTYPNIRQVIPADSERTVTVNRKALGQALSEAAPYLVGDPELSIGQEAITLEFTKDKIAVKQTKGRPQFHVEHSVPVLESKGKTEPLSVGFNIDFLLDQIANSDSKTVQLKVSDALSPLVVSDADGSKFGVLMPMRLNARNDFITEPSGLSRPQFDEVLSRETMDVPFAGENVTAFQRYDDADEFVKAMVEGGEGQAAKRGTKNEIPAGEMYNVLSADTKNPLSRDSKFWMSPDGRWISTKGNEHGRSIGEMESNGVNTEDFLRVNHFSDVDGNVLGFQGRPTDAQWRELRDASIQNRSKLMDDSGEVFYDPRRPDEASPRFYRSRNGQVRAVTMGKRSWFFLDRYENMGQLRQDIREEAGHRLVNELGGKEWSNVGRLTYGGKWLQIREEIKRNYGYQEGTPEFNHEFVAKAFRDGKNNAPLWRRFLDAMVAAFKRFMRRLEIRNAKIRGWLNKFSDAEIRSFINDLLSAKARMQERGAVSGTPVMAAVQRESAPTFYSALERRVADPKMPNRATRQQWLAIIDPAKGAGVKQEEVDWSGVKEWLNTQPALVNKADVLNFIRANRIEVQEVVKGRGEQSAMDSAVNDYREWWATHGKGQIPVEVEDILTDWNAEEMTTANASRELMVYDDSVGNGKFAEFVSKATPFSEGTKFYQYQLPGGENYRELLLTLPVPRYESRLFNLRPIGDGNYEVTRKDNGSFVGQYPSLKQAQNAIAERDNRPIPFQSSHWSELNVLAHVRFNERWTSSDGTSYTPPQKTLFIEEIQSDWHQRGREVGYGPDNRKPWIVDKRGNTWVVRNAISGEEVNARINTEDGAIAEAGRFNELRTDLKLGVPDAPFKTTWPLLAFKRMIRYAAENGFDKIAWTTGEQQAERYDISKHVDEVQFVYDPKTGRGDLSAMKGEQAIIEKGDIESSELASYVGKDIAKRLMDQPGESAESIGLPKHKISIVSGDGLRVGGEGMKGFYDIILPAEVNKYVKKWGAKVGESKIGKGTKDTWSVYRGDDLYEAYSTEEKAKSQAEALNNASHTKLFSYRNDADEEPETFSSHSIDITPAMLDAVLYEGQPQFAMYKDLTAEQVKEYRAKLSAGFQSRTKERLKAARERILGKQQATIEKITEQPPSGKIPRTVTAPVYTAYNLGIEEGYRAGKLKTVDMAFEDAIRKHIGRSRTGRAKEAEFIENAASAREAGLSRMAVAKTDEEREQIAKSIIRDVFGSDEYMNIRRATRGPALETLKDLDKYLDKRLGSYYAEKLAGILATENAQPRYMLPEYKDEMESKLRQLPVTTIEGLRNAIEYSRRLRADHKRVPTDPYYVTELDRQQEIADKLRLELDRHLEGSKWEDLRGLYQSIAEIVAGNRSEKILELSDRKENLDQLAAAATQEVERSAPVLPSVTKQEKTPRNRGIWRGWLRGQRENAHTMTLEMSAGNPNGVVAQVLDKDLQKGHTKSLNVVMKIETAFHNKLKEMGVKRSDLIKWATQKKPYDIGGKEIKLTDVQAMTLAASMMRKYGKAQVLSAGVRPENLRNMEETWISDDQIMTEMDFNRIIGSLTGEQQEIVEHIVTALTGMADAANQVSLSLFGYEKFNEDPYFPLRRDISGRMRTTVITEDSTPRSFRNKSLENAGFTKETISNKNPVLLGNIFDIFNEHVQQMAAFTELTIPIHNALTMMNDAAFKDAVIKRYGTSQLQELREMMARLAGLKGHSDSWKFWNRFFEKWGRNVSVSLLGYNVKTILYNSIGGSFMAMSELSHINPAMALSYARRRGMPSKTFWVFPKNRKAIKYMMKNNGYLWERWAEDSTRVQANLPTEVGEKTAKTRLGMLWREWQNKALRPMAEAEMKNGVTIFRTAKDFGYTDEAAMQLVEDITRQTQNPSSALEETRTYSQVKESGLTLLFPFLGQPTVMSNILLRDWLIYKNAKAGKKAKAARGLIFTMLAVASNIALVVGLQELWMAMKKGFKKESDEDKRRKRIALNAAGNVIDLYAPPASRLLDIIDGVSAQGTIRDESMAGRVLENYAKAYRGIKEIYAPGKDYQPEKVEKGFDSLAKALSMTTGAPVGGLIDIGEVVAGLSGHPIGQPAQTPPPRLLENRNGETSEARIQAWRKKMREEMENRSR
jgi:DNA polymerase III sliding clamp (beta) subunit (PCNA family)